MQTFTKNNYLYVKFNCDMIQDIRIYLHIM